jgi:hypothetical protein
MLDCTKHQTYVNKPYVCFLTILARGDVVCEKLTLAYCVTIVVQSVMKEKEYVAYLGIKYQIEWFYSEKGESQALDYFNSLDKGQRIKFLYLIKRMGEIGRINDKTKFVNEGDQIFAFKPQPDRFLCFFEQCGKIIITNAFCKKQQKLPKNEKERALLCKLNYEKRIKEGLYYD